MIAFADLMPSVRIAVELKVELSMATWDPGHCGYEAIAPRATEGSAGAAA